MKNRASYQLLLGKTMVTVTPKRVKRITLRILPPDGRVVMTVPAGVTREGAERFLREKQVWVETHRARVTEKPENMAQRGILKRELDLLGERVRVSVVQGGKTTLENGALILGVRGGTNDEASARLEAYLRARLAALAEEMMPHLARRIGVTYSRVTIRRMTTRWGSCNTRTGHITLNLHLMHYPLSCVEYVMVHELCHLLVAAHDDRFWRLVEKHAPEWREAKKRLKSIRDV